MEVIEIIKQRKSIRHFRPEPPSRELLQECLEAATWAPNPTTQQPWKFIVLSGDALAHVAGVIENHFSSAQKRTGHEPVPTLREETRMLLEERKNQTFQHMLSFLKEKGETCRKSAGAIFASTMHRWELYLQPIPRRISTIISPVLPQWKTLSLLLQQRDWARAG